MSLTVVVNGRERTLEELARGCSLRDLLTGIALKADRVAVELNGTICARSGWDGIMIDNGDRLEIVHFVGGGSSRSR